MKWNSTFGLMRTSVNLILFIAPSYSRKTLEFSGASWTDLWKMQTAWRMKRATKSLRSSIVVGCIYIYCGDYKGEGNKEIKTCPSDCVSFPQPWSSRSLICYKLPAFI